MLVAVISKSILTKKKNLFETEVLKMFFKMCLAHSRKLVTIEICSYICQFWTMT